MTNGFNFQYLYIIFGWVVTIAALLLFVPKKKITEAIVAFQFKQVITWVLGLVVVQLGLITYPVRSLAKATLTSFDFEYFIYPAISAIFIVHYPEKKRPLIQFLYYSVYCTAITVIEVFVERYTDIVKYQHWTWYITWLTLYATLYICRKAVLWFFKRLRVEAKMGD